MRTMDVLHHQIILTGDGHKAHTSFAMQPMVMWMPRSSALLHNQVPSVILLVLLLLTHRHLSAKKV